MLDANFLGELRYAVAAASLEPAARAKVDDMLLDLADAVANVEQAPALPWRIVAALCSKVHDSIKAGEIAAERDRRGLPPLAQVA
jgi:hypothetical protein